MQRILAGIAWMDTGYQTLLSRDLLQEIAELALFIVGECRQERMLVLARDAANRLECGSAGLRQMQSVTPAIGFVGAPLKEPARFQFIDQRHQTAR